MRAMFPALVLGAVVLQGAACADDGPLGDPATGGIVGRVTVDGLPQEGVELVASRDDTVVGRGVTDGNGEYALDALAPGTYAVEISTPTDVACPAAGTAVVAVGGEATVDFACETPDLDPGD